MPHMSVCVIASVPACPAGAILQEKALVSVAHQFAEERQLVLTQYGRLIILKPALNDSMASSTGFIILR